MRAWEKLRLRLRSLFQRDAVERDLDAELQFHLKQLIGEYRAAGLSQEEAESAALSTLGPITRIKEECRDVRGER
jgi:putative ABC transport system permease protein